MMHRSDWQDCLNTNQLLQAPRRGTPLLCWIQTGDYYLCRRRGSAPANRNTQGKLYEKRHQTTGKCHHTCFKLYSVNSSCMFVRGSSTSSPRGRMTSCSERVKYQVDIFWNITCMASRSHELLFTALVWIYLINIVGLPHGLFSSRL